MYSQQQQGRHLTHEQFRVELANDFLRDASHPDPAASSNSPSRGHRQESLNPLSRLTERHFPGQLEKSASGQQLQRDCTVCSKWKGRRRKTTTYCCKQGKLPMRVVPCFAIPRQIHNATCKHIHMSLTITSTVRAFFCNSNSREGSTVLSNVER